MNRVDRRTQRAMGAMQIVDKLLHLAVARDVTIDGYEWSPDPAHEKFVAGSEHYFLTVSSGRRHAQAKFSRAFLEDSPAGEGVAIQAVLGDVVAALSG